MSTLFTSVVKVNEEGNWYIEITDTVDSRKETCVSIDEYAVKIEELGADYGGDIEVKWSADENVSPLHMDEVRFQMAKYQEKYADQEEQSS